MGLNSLYCFLKVQFLSFLELLGEGRFKAPVSSESIFFPLLRELVSFKSEILFFTVEF